MKAVFILSLVLAVLEARGQVLTNDVAIGDTRFRLVVSDEVTQTAALADRELEVGRQVMWLLYTPATNQWNNIVFLGVSNSFALELRTPGGVVIPATAAGKAINAGPRSLTNFRANRSWWIGSRLGEFPPIEELFRIPSNGVYFLEVRYWAWSPANKRFALSSPVRVRVMKK